MDKTKLIELLNADLELEYRSIVQYVTHIATVKGAEYQSTLDELDVHVKQELDHALTLARQIDFLGGSPSTRVPAIPWPSDSRRALENDLELETTQLERYRERVAQAEEFGLPDVAEALAPLLQQTQEHARDLPRCAGLMDVADMSVDAGPVRIGSADVPPSDVPGALALVHLK